MVETDEIRPDQVVGDGGLPFPDGSVERVYLGHLLEHLEWDTLPAYLLELWYVLARGASLLVVGPDVERAFNRYHLGLEPWSIVTATMEGEGSELGGWVGARHCWNCTEARVVGLLGRCGFVDVAAVPLEPSAVDGWPVVSLAPWQCAVSATRP